MRGEPKNEFFCCGGHKFIAIKSCVEEHENKHIADIKDYMRRQGITEQSLCGWKHNLPILVHKAKAAELEQAAYAVSLKCEKKVLDKECGGGTCGMLCE